MRNRIRNLNKNTADFETLLNGIDKDLANTFADIDFTEMAGTVLHAWQVDLQTIMICEQEGNDELLTNEDVEAVIKILNTVNRILKDPKAPEETKALLVESYFRHLLRYLLCKEKYHGEKLFERRAEIEKGNPLRDLFIVRYIENEVYPRFYEAQDKERDEALKAKGIDLDKYYEEYDEKRTDEEVEKDDKEYKEHTNELFREYGEGDLIGYNPSKIIKEWENKLPEDIKEEMKKREAEKDRELDVLEKVMELTEEKGITDEEAVKLLTDEEREILRKGETAGDTPHK